MRCWFSKVEQAAPFYLGPSKQFKTEVSQLIRENQYGLVEPGRVSYQVEKEKKAERQVGDADKLEEHDAEECRVEQRW